MAAALLAAAALAVGYVLGRVRPWDRLDTWVWRRLAFGGAWTRSRPQQVLTLVVHVLVRPRASWNSWRRNDPPSAPVPPVRVRDLREPEPPQ